MKYKLINRTKISSKIIHKLIQFVCPKGVDRFVISIMRDRDGSALEGETLLKLKTIKIYIRDRNKYPRLSNNKNTKKAGYNPIFFIRNNREAVLSLLAHELRHLWQEYVSKRIFWNGKLCKYVCWDKKTYTTIYKMEKDACEYTRKMLFTYRKLKYK